MGIGSVGGVIEVDEAFFRQSFKDNHNKNTAFKMPLKSHKRGVKGNFNSKDEKRKIGISKEQDCVLCAIDRTVNLITELICKGRIKDIDLERLFRDRIEDEAILCTHSHKSYIQFPQNLGIELQQIKSGKHKEGIYHIQNINTFHSKLKKRMDRFNCVATKYLANYMYWFK